MSVEAVVASARQRWAPPAITATITAGDVTITRELPRLGFALKASESLDARLPAGPFRAIIEVVFDPGSVREATIGADVAGCRLAVRQGGRILLTSAAEDAPRRAMTGAPVRLAPGRDRLTFEIEAPRAGPVAVRALWQPIGAPVVEPLPAAGAPPLAMAALRGLALAQDLGCAQCHVPRGAPLRDRLGGSAAPILTGAGASLRPAWLRKWIADPPGLKRGARMPRIDLGEEDLEDLVHLIAAQGGPPSAGADAAGAAEALVATGRVAYHRSGCFACHGPLEPPEAIVGLGAAASEPPRDTYHDLGAPSLKSTPSALASFLADPLARRPAGLMPALALEPVEARAIAAYLFAREGAGMHDAEGDRLAIDPARVERGALRFASAGCAACHVLEHRGRAIAPALAAPALEDLAGRAGRGCLNATKGTVPAFAFAPGQREDLATFLDSIAERRCEEAPIDRLAVDLARFGCHRCHAGDGTSGPEAAVAAYFATEGEADLGEEGRRPPRLDDAGARLTPEWMHEVLERGARARPYLAARMPQFGAANVGHLPALFAAAAGAAALPRAEPAFTLEAAAAGRRLVGAGGLNCIQCHVIADHPATGTPGPDLALMPGRLRFDHFARWLHDPSRVSPGTRMPTFFSGGIGAVTDVLGGRADEQVAAIWSYLSQGSGLALPEGLVDPGSFELVVGVHPIVLRTFMKDSGVRAIACGFPAGVHCAFDADRCVLAAAWTGRFLSAAGAWAARGGSETNPDAIAWAAPAGPVLELAPGATTVRFRGYALGADRAPTLEYELRAGAQVVAVAERPEPRVEAGAQVLARVFTLRGAPGTEVIVHASALGASDFTARLDADGRAEFELEVRW